jgi:hypothetical protein
MRDGAQLGALFTLSVGGKGSKVKSIHHVNFAAGV